MLAHDRRSTQRRRSAASTPVALGAAPPLDRRTAVERRRAPRRRADLRSIAQFAERIEAGETRLEVVIVDGVDGLRLVAVFACGCSATEPVGTGPAVRIDACPAHAVPLVAHERRRN